MLAFLLTFDEVIGLEAMMLICFGFSWPISILKSYRTKQVRGKSLMFMSLILLGYIAGTAYKFGISAVRGTPLDWTVSLYILNALLVITDISLYIKYNEIDAPTAHEKPNGKD